MLKVAHDANKAHSGVAGLLKHLFFETITFQLSGAGDSALASSSWRQHPAFWPLTMRCMPKEAVSSRRVEC